MTYERQTSEAAAERWEPASGVGEASRDDKEFDFSSGRLCLDLANTESERHLSSARDQLETYADLVAWARQAGAITAEAATSLLETAGARPAEAEQVLAAARDLRRAIYGTISATAAGRAPEPRQLVDLSDALCRLLACSRLISGDGRFSWEWAGPRGALDRPLWAAARSAADLLTSADLASVRECASPTCSWLFVDTSRNHSRRWCDMKVCGNRAKARRHYERHKGD